MTTTHIIFTGRMIMDYHGLSGNGRKMQRDLAEHKKIWNNDKTHTDIRNRFWCLEGLLYAVQTGDVEEIAKIYYRAQHQHTLNKRRSPYQFPVYICSKALNPAWMPHIHNALKCINSAAPGLHLYEINDITKAKIVFSNIGSQEEAWTEIGTTGDDPEKKHTKYAKNREHTAKTRIHLGNNIPADKIKGTSVHELLHALGLMHEMQRKDACLYLDIKAENRQYHGHIKPLTRFDPFSILMYPETTAMTRKDKDPIWKMKPKTDRCQELSELDKVALNLLFPPCTSPEYAPKISLQTGMLYCGRVVMENHNQCTTATTDNRCGPNNWANCPACRVIKTVVVDDGNVYTTETITKLKSCINRGMWQGLSGLFYCGRRYSGDFFTIRKGQKVYSDGVCGIDNGIPCSECGSELCYNYSWEIFKPNFVKY